MCVLLPSLLSPLGWQLTQGLAADFLKVALEAYWHGGRPLSETLPLCERIWKALPAVFKIWGGYSSVSLKEQMHQLDQWAQRAYTGLLEEKYTMETPSASVPIFSLRPTLTMHKPQSDIPFFD